MNKLSLYEFMLKQVDRDDPVGDLAADMSRDKTVPKGSNKLGDWLGHLTLKRACREAKATLIDAFVEYENQC